MKMPQTNHESSRFSRRKFTFGLTALAFTSLVGGASAEPLKIGYSDWPGWVAWEIGIKKDWFKEEGVEVKFEWYDYVESMDAYVAGQIDAVGMTNGDALVTGSTGKPSVCILINDYSNGNDMIVAKPGIESVKDLKGKKVGLEEGFVSHLMLLKALEILASRVSVKPAEYEPFLDGTYILSGEEVKPIWEKADGLKSVYGSSKISDEFNVTYKVYEKPMDIEKFLDPSITLEVIAEMAK